jgi:hypothetical protein
MKKISIIGKMVMMILALVVMSPTFDDAIIFSRSLEKEVMTLPSISVVLCRVT